MEIVQDITLYRQINHDFKSSTPLFFMAFWLDQVCGKEQWIPYVLMDEENPKAIFPIYTKKKWAISAIVMPLLTPYLSMHILSEKDRVHYGIYLQQFQKYLSHHFMVAISSHYTYSSEVTSWQTLGYETIWRNTHTFTPQSYQSIKKLYNKQLIRDINNANKNLTIEIQKHSHDIYPLVCETFERQKLAAPVSKTFLSGIIDQLPENNFVLTAKYHGQPVAAILILVDELSFYYILSGRSSEAPRGSVAALLDKAIELAMEKSLIFDFEGSSIESIAIFFRNFNPVHHRFIHAVKYKRPWIKAIYQKLKR